MSHATASAVGKESSLIPVFSFIRQFLSNRSLIYIIFTERNRFEVECYGPAQDSLMKQYLIESLINYQTSLHGQNGRDNRASGDRLLHTSDK